MWFNESTGACQMAIKQRALRKLETAKNHMLRALNAGDATALDEACQDLTDARNLCKEGLPRSGYAAYEEIYDGLILVVQKMIEDGEAGEQEEVDQVDVKRAAPDVLHRAPQAGLA